MPSRHRDADQPVAPLRPALRDEDTLPERIELLEEHAASVARQIDELRRQQDKLASKLDWYRGEHARRISAEAGS